MKTRFAILLLLVLVILVFVARSCLSRLIDAPVAIWTPAPATEGPASLTPGALILPTPVEPQLPLSTPVQGPIATASLTPAPAAQPTPNGDATPDPNLVTITEADVLAALTSGAGEQGGLMLESPSVRFLDGKLQVAAARLQYGPVDVQNLVLIGRLVAQAGRLQLETESISPRGLVTALIPTFANQALAQYASQWYVEEVRTLDGRLELKIR